MPSLTTTEYYTDKSIFITGATGFMGKVLVEKLLRSCPGIKTIYLLVRSKKGQSAEERLKYFINSRVFDKVKEKNPDAFNKLRLVTGDITVENLGISVKDEQELHSECQIVISIAASVRFDLSIRDAVTMNTVGTQKLLHVCEKMQKLEVFLHVSTTFCHDDIEVLDEKIYPSKHDPQVVIDMLKWMDDETLASAQPKFIQPHPNTYSYSKCLTEQLVSQYSGKFPIVIARPSIVTGSVNEPMPGWIDNINGPAGVIYAAYRGILHTMYCKESTPCDTVPVDIAINAIILLIYLTASEKSKGLRVCNISSYNTAMHNYWAQASRLGVKYMQKYPLSYALWYTAANPKSYKLENTIDEFFTQTLPAYLIDLILFLIGQKTFMINVLHRLNLGINLLEYYNTKEWTFKNDCFKSLQKQITKEDNEIFQTDPPNFRMEEFVENYIKGIREFYCKEDPSTLPQARKFNKRLYYLHITTKYFVRAIFLYLLYWFILKIYIFFN